MSAKEILRQLLADGQNDQVAEGLLKAARANDNSSFLNNVELWAGRFNTLENNNLKGLLKETSYYRELNKLRLAAQKLIDKLPDSFILPKGPTSSNKESNAMDFPGLPSEITPVSFVSVPALATGKTRPQTGGPDDDAMLEKIKDTCILEIEKNLRNMANHYFDENGFERPKATGAYFIQSYLTLQGLKLKEIETSLRTINTGQHNFIQPVKTLSDDLKARCAQLAKLMDNRACRDISIRSSLEKTVTWIELLEEELPTLIADRSTERRGAFKSNYLIPLADQMHQLQEKMSGFDVEQPNAELN